VTNTARRQELAASLAQHLAEATSSERLDPWGRLNWLSHHLELYVGRFAGFAALRVEVTSELLAHDLFRCVEIGVEAVSAELRAAGSPAELSRRWDEFHSAIDAVRRSPSRERAETLNAAIATWRSALIGYRTEFRR
jgi:hypothetical protein